MAKVTITISEANAEADNKFASTIDQPANGRTFRRQLSANGELPAERRIANWSGMEGSIFDRAKKILGTTTEQETIAALMKRDGWQVYIDTDIQEILQSEGMKFVQSEINQ